MDKEGIPAAIRDGLWQGETAVLNRDGQEIPVSQVILAHYRADGSVEFLSTIIRDISERKREEIARMEWANRYNAAIRASGQLLFDWNSFTNDITYAGDVEHFLGYTMREMAGGLDRFRELIVPQDLAAFDVEIQRVTATRDPFRLEFQVRRKDGTAVDVAAKGYFFLDREGRIGRMIGFLADVTAQKAAQDALARAHENLELRVEQRTAELARAYTVIRDRAHQQEAVAQLGQRALAGADLAVLLQQASSLVQRILAVDFCSILQPSEDGTEMVATAHSGWPDELLGNRVPDRARLAVRLHAARARAGDRRGHGHRRSLRGLGRGPRIQRRQQRERRHRGERVSRSVCSWRSASRRASSCRTTSISCKPWPTC